MSVRQWIVIILLAFSVFINYFDRGNLSVAAPQLSGELSLTPSNMGILLSAFFWTYAVCQLLGGWLVDRDEGMSTPFHCRRPHVNTAG